MHILRTKNEISDSLHPLRIDNKTIGFVPTMGALHEGHLSLIHQAKLSSDSVLVSIFINPTQFNSKEDFEKYPQTLEEDLQVLAASGVDYVFLPHLNEIYPEPTTLNFDFGDLERTLEGTFRPGHFNGVGLVVSKLLNIVKPNKAYFGQKDLQQVAIIKRLVKDLSFDVEIIVVETKREQDGLAMSSRNLRLSLEERTIATLLYKCLIFGKDELLAGKDWFEVKDRITNRFHNEPQARLEYYEWIESDTFGRVTQIQNSQKTSICIAAYIGEVRLIDNLTITE
ncbi:pantoate--beta-alanine ligase [Rhodonellum sp.]|uniref:pantoate--beta-alanine ligase n=1 Tax=Rhodonellum sp. TaxID=2231180 RepID=UPI00271D310D|nr:pantoate--beta-alanine ligase [Rhodonellum sp.]MDO9552588.1 pantoate--beta-alanine ligase [Rhodonellum sp.]